MAKGYWVSAYRTISDPEKLAAYNKLAGPAQWWKHEANNDATNGGTS